MQKTMLSLILAAFVLSQSFLCVRPNKELAASPVSKRETLMPYDLAVLASDSLTGRGTGTEGERKAGTYLERRFKEIGLAPKGTDGTYFQSFSFKPHPPVQMHQVGDSLRMGMPLVKEITGRNVIGFLDYGAASTIIIGAHYDHLGMGDENSLWAGEPAIHNGADDNASGVSVLLELAAEIRENPAIYKNYNYLFIAFSGEEKGLWGSNYFSKNPTIDLTTVNAMLNMDMVGRLNTEKKLAVNGTGTSPVWAEIIPAIQVDSIITVPSESGVGPSDHTSFYNVGIPVLHFFTGQHEDYHKPSDDAEKINYAGLVSVKRYVQTVIIELARRDRITFTKTNDEKQATAADFKVTLGVVPDYLYGGPGMRVDGTREGRPAHKAGIIQGDIVHRIGDQVVTDMMSYMEALGKFEKGQTTDVEIERKGERLVLQVVWD